MKFTFLLAVLLSYHVMANAQSVNIIPKPQQLTINSGSFTLSSATVIVADEADLNSINFLNDYLQSYYGFTVKRSAQAEKNVIRLSTSTSSGNTEGYQFSSTPATITITGNSHQGTFYGLQTLLQLLPVEKTSMLKIASITAKDEPRFKYRGLMLDVGRHFMPVSFVKKYINYIALFKLNTFHWHLTDDQGWRIEIKKYPRLTSVGGFRDGTIIGHYPGTGNDNKPTGGFYTQEEIKEIVRYAQDRFVTIIPELELPGHASAAIAAYPELSCFPKEPTKINGANTLSVGALAKQAGGIAKVVQETWGIFPDVFVPTDSTFTFLENVLDEIMPLFPSKYMHIGGDECPKESWKRSPFCQQLIKSHNLKDEHGLQSYFIQRIETYVNSKGKKIIGWDEILEGGLAQNATVMSWRGEQGGIDAAKLGHDVIMTPGKYVYFDHNQLKENDTLTIGGYLPLKQVYDYNPIPAALTAAEGLHVLGAQANVWTEYMVSQAKIEYMIFPRLAALAEVLWTQPENKNWDNFLKAVPVTLGKLKAMNVNYCPKY